MWNILLLFGCWFILAGLFSFFFHKFAAITFCVVVVIDVAGVTTTIGNGFGGDNGWMLVDAGTTSVGADICLNIVVGCSFVSWFFSSFKFFFNISILNSTKMFFYRTKNVFTKYKCNNWYEGHNNLIVKWQRTQINVIWILNKQFMWCDWDEWRESFICITFSIGFLFFWQIWTRNDNTRNGNYIAVATQTTRFSWCVFLITRPIFRIIHTPQLFQSSKLEEKRLNSIAVVYIVRPRNMVE